jgi:hypothetical protein
MVGFNRFQNMRGRVFGVALGRTRAAHRAELARMRAELGARSPAEAQRVAAELRKRAGNKLKGRD